MRIVNGVLAVLMIVFAAVQYNDPDGPFWAGVYGAGALWCAIAALKPTAAVHAGVLAAFGLTGLAAVVGTIRFWPATPDWWMQDVWWETETAREGMGMMIVVICLILSGIVLLRERRAAA